MPYTLEQAAIDYGRIEQTIGFIEANTHRQPTLAEIAAHVHLSEFHFQRLFRRWVGISPKRFLQFLTKEHAKALLQRSRNLLEVTFETGLSSPGRLHDLFIQCEAVTPGEFKHRGSDLKVEYGFHPTPFGECFIALTRRGICHFSFVKESRQDEVAILLRRWRNATLVEESSRTRAVVDAIFTEKPGHKRQPLNLLLRGTNFQIKVWEALLRIPPGTVIAYDDVAHMIGRPKATRAVANAVGANPVALLIPCHRVIRKTGAFGGYEGGTVRKKALLARESAMMTTE